MSADVWTYQGRYGYECKGPLSLSWEVSGDPISDDYIPEEISAEELLRLWVRRYPPAPHDPWATIYWSVHHVQGSETAPFQLNEFPSLGDFLTFYTWPVNARGERVQWTRLPVKDKLWHPAKGRRPERGDKGGFIQEATGWKPSPLQDRVHVPNLLRAAGFGGLVPGVKA